MNFKNMREYTHEEFINLIKCLNENELIELSSKYGGYPVLFRMALDERVGHMPFIQTGSSVIICREDGKILLQERIDRDAWSLPGGCQELGEDLRITAVREVYEETGIKLNPDDLVLLDTLSGKSRRNSYPNGDIVYNNTSLYFANVLDKDISLKGDFETKRLLFFDIEHLPNNFMDKDLVKVYIDKRASRM